jgi:hypothetical protein
MTVVLLVNTAKAEMLAKKLLFLVTMCELKRQNVLHIGGAFRELSLCVNLRPAHVGLTLLSATWLILREK